MTNGKFAAMIGSYEAGPMGVLVLRQEGEKLIATAPGGERVELTAAATADTFNAQSVGATIRFERDAAGAVTAITVTMADGREIKGKKTK